MNLPSSIDRTRALQFCEDELLRRLGSELNLAGHWECKLKICQKFRRFAPDVDESSAPLTDVDRAWLMQNHHFLEYPTPPSHSHYELSMKKRELISRILRSPA
jgi:hypothetical protein